MAKDKDEDTRPWEYPVGDPRHEDRDIEAHPYDRQEARVAEYLAETGGIGAGDDPIGFLIASHNALRDDPDMDATDYAHPAWWRGHHAGVAGTVRRLKNTLDGEDNGRGVIGYKPLEDLRRQILCARYLLGDT